MKSFGEWLSEQPVEESAGSKLANLARKQKENTGPALKELKAKGDPDAAKMIAIKAAWARAGKPGTLADFATKKD